MNGSHGAWSRRRWVSSDAHLEKSAYILFAEFCSATMVQPAEIGKVLKINGRRLSVFHLSAGKASELAVVMGMDLQRWDLARGADVLGERISKRVYLGELRYCPTCLISGHHSTLFQLTQVMKCPIHKVPLKMGCPHCGRPIPTSLLDVARDHMYCGACGRRLAVAQAGTSLARSTDHPAATLFAQLRQALVGDPQAGELRNDLPWGKLPAEVVVSSVLVRRHHICSVWGSNALGSDFLNTRTTSSLLEIEEKPARPSEPGHHLVFRPTYRRTMEAFENLASLLECDRPMGAMPQGVLSNARVDEAVPAVSAAYWHAARTMSVHTALACTFSYEESRRRRLLEFGWGAWFQPWLPDHDGAVGEVVRSAVYSLFALCLARAGRLRYGVQMAWDTPPPWHEFLPPWRLLPRAGTNQLQLQVRTRADERLVRRLMSRYRAHELLKVPEGVSPLELINHHP